MKLLVVAAALGLCLVSSSDDRFTGLKYTSLKPFVLKKGEYSVTILQRKGDPKVDAGFYQGFYCGVVVKEIKVAYKGEKLEMQRAAFADLATIRNPKLEVKGNRATLKISGGDPLDGYDCTINLINGLAVSREVRNTESHQVVEKSQYDYESVDLSN